MKLTNFARFLMRRTVGTHFAYSRLCKESPIWVIETDVLQEREKNVVRS